MSYTKLSGQEFDTPNDNNNNPPTTETTLFCDKCKNPITEWGIIHIKQLETTKQITFLCSESCRNKTKENRICPQCGNQFDIYKKTKSFQKFCSRECRTLGTKIRCGLCQNCGNHIGGFEKGKKKIRKYCSKQCSNEFRGFTYNTHYFCDFTAPDHWVKIADAVKVKEGYFTCPNYSHAGHRLRMSSRKGKLNRKRKEAKRIE